MSHHSKQHADPSQIPALMLKVQQLESGGHTREAINQCLNLCQIFPENAEIWFLFGTLNDKYKLYFEAEKCFRRVLELQTNMPEAHDFLGKSLFMQQRYSNAETCFNTAITLKPNFPQAHNHLAHTLFRLGKLEQSKSSFQRALAYDDSDIDSLIGLGELLTRKNQFEPAEKCLRQAIDIQPNNTSAYLKLGNCLRLQEKPDKVVTAYQNLISISPNNAEAHNQLGVALTETGKPEQARTCFKQAITIKPDLIWAHNNIANNYLKAGRSNDAEKHFKKAIQLQPKHPLAYSNMGKVMLQLGNNETAESYYREALTLKPDFAEAFSNLLLIMNYNPNHDSSHLANEHLKWGAQFEQPRNASRKYSSTKDPSRRLRIGYVSPDFRNHPVASFFEGLLSHHDKNQIETFCYSCNTHSDDTTKRLRNTTDHWRSLIRQSDQHAAELIYKDNIDILVDLAGHTSHNRLPVFAYRPAPIQISYLGYPNTTGLAAIDYRLTDNWADPEGMTDDYYTEQLIRLPQGFLCFTPPDDAPSATKIAASNKPHTTFGSFNNFTKLTDKTVQVWAEIIKSLPESQLILKTAAFSDPASKKHCLTLFAKAGIAAERLELIAWCPSRADHLALYNRIDIALDTFPYNGTTTTCEALWMGVPVITLAEQKHAGRVGVSILSQLGLEELIAEDTENYIKLAIQLAQNPEKQALYNKNLRHRMSDSPLCDSAGFTRRIEGTYQQMWQKWCSN